MNLRYFQSLGSKYINSEESLLNSSKYIYVYILVRKWPSIKNVVCLLYIFIFISVIIILYYIKFDKNMSFYST